MAAANGRGVRSKVREVSIESHLPLCSMSMHVKQLVLHWLLQVAAGTWEPVISEALMSSLQQCLQVITECGDLVRIPFFCSS